MISTKLSIDHVPTTWIFEYYCKLDQRLHGQDVKMRSMFNPTERTPSMFLFCKEGEYLFKDHSSGYGGSGIILVMKLYGLSYTSAVNKIAEDYENRYEGTYDEIELIDVPKFQVTDWKERLWTRRDAEYWTQFNIGSKLLEHYQVKPLSEFTITRGEEEILIKSNMIYGYFDYTGSLIKVYQPSNDRFKFFTVSDHIQGADQLQYKQDTLVICSSMKDIMSLVSLSLGVEAIAPSGEGIMIPKERLSAYALKYKKILTLFDNDQAGHKSMQKYQDMYGIRGIYLNLSKDVSDSIRDHGAEKTKNCIKPLL